MPGAGRLGDKANVSADAHGCPACPHPAVGPGIQGSPNVMINKRPALRVDDIGIHAACCGPNMWTAQKGAPHVNINGKPAFRMSDQSIHCGSSGHLIEGSADVIIGDSGGGGGGGGGGGSGNGTGGSGGGGSGGGGSGGGGSGSGGASGGGSGASSSSGSSSSGGSSASSASSASGNSSSGSSGSAASSGSSTSEQKSDPAETRADQIEIQLVNAAGQPRPNVRFELTFPDGSKKTGRSDDSGWIRFSGLTQSGDCKLTLPQIDEPNG